MHERIPERSGYESTIGDFIISAQTLVAETREVDIQLIDLAAIQMRTMAIHWRIFMQYADTRLFIIEWVLQRPNPETARSLEETLEQLHPRRRRIPFYRNILSRTTHTISLLARTSTVRAAIIAIDENMKAARNSNDVARITYLAFVFVVLSFLPGIFSMDRGFPEAGRDYCLLGFWGFGDTDGRDTVGDRFGLGEDWGQGAESKKGEAHGWR